MKTRTLAKALHTVTSVARVAEFLRLDCRMVSTSDEVLALSALRVLGYSIEEVNRAPDLLAACVKAVAAGAAA